MDQWIVLYCPPESVYWSHKEVNDAQRTRVMFEKHMRTHVEMTSLSLELSVVNLLTIQHFRVEIKHVS